MSSDLYFNCHGCGKCCNSGPNIKFDEILKYIDKFGMNVQINVSEQLLTDPYVKTEEFQYVKELYPWIKVDYKIYLYQASIYTLNVKSQNKCEMLMDDGKCKIYNDRPDICHLVPFTATMKEELQYQGPMEGMEDLFIDAGCMKKEKTEGYRPIYINKKMDSEFLAKKEAIKNDFILNRMVTYHFLDSMKNIFNFPLFKPGTYSLSIGWYLNFMRFMENISNEEFIDAINKQNIVLQGLVDKSLSIKNKDDRKNTNAYKGFIVQNNTLLKMPYNKDKEKENI